MYEYLTETMIARQRFADWAWDMREETIRDLSIRRTSSLAHELAYTANSWAQVNDEDLEGDERDAQQWLEDYTDELIEMLRESLED